MFLRTVLNEYVQRVQFERFLDMMRESGDGPSNDAAWDYLLTFYVLEYEERARHGDEARRKLVRVHENLMVDDRSPPLSFRVARRLLICLDNMWSCATGAGGLRGG